MAVKNFERKYKWRTTLKEEKIWPYSIMVEKKYNLHRKKAANFSLKRKTNHISVMAYKNVRVTFCEPIPVSRTSEMRMAED